MDEQQREQQRKETEKMREDTPGCRETMRGGGLRRILPGEPDYQYTVPLGDSTKAHFVLCNAGFENTLKEPGHCAYVRIRQPGQRISGWPVPTPEDVENAYKTFQSMGYLARVSGGEVTELVDSVHQGYPHTVPPELRKAAAPSLARFAYRLGTVARKIAGR